MKKLNIIEFWNSVKMFLGQIRLGYLLFSSLLILGFTFGIFEIIDTLFFSHATMLEIRWLYLSRSIITSIVLVLWSAWTVFHYREVYQEKLKSTETRYRDIIENTTDAILTVNNDDIVTTWNHGAELMFGWKREEILEKPISTIIPDDLLKNSELSTLKTGVQLRGHLTDYETERITKDGRRLHIQLSENRIIDENHRPIGRSQIMRDQTENRIRERQMQQSERLAAVGHMAAGVAHEVGNPLSAISSLVQLVQRRSDDPFVKENLTKVRENINRITKIVRDLVDFSRPPITRVSNTQINDVIMNSIGLLKHDSRCRNILFDPDLDESLPTVNCVPDHISQVLINLLLNAVDAVQNADNKSITIRTRNKDEVISIHVTDYGCGIPANIKDKIFEPFFTTKEVGSGTGLGLSVSHGLIKRMGGDISVESSPGNGATFKITLLKH